MQYGSMLFLFATGMAESGIHKYFKSMKIVRDMNSSRTGKEPHVIVRLLSFGATVCPLCLCIAYVLVPGGIISNEEGEFYHSVYGPIFDNVTTYYTVFYSTSPIGVSMIAALSITPFIFGITMVLVRREINVFCRNLLLHRGMLIHQHFLQKLRQNYEIMFNLVEVTSRIWSPYYGMMTFCNVASAIFLGFNAFYPSFDVSSLQNFAQAVFNIFALTSVAIFMNTGVSIKH